MSSASDTDTLGATRLPTPRLALVLSALIFLVAPLWQQRWGTIPDTSWLITVCERIVSGERLYIDVIDNNPPFSFWLFMPAILVSKWSSIAPEICIYVYSCLAVIAGLGVAAVIIRRAGFAESHALLRQLPLFVALFVIFPGNAFTERDQLGAVLLLPLLALMAWRAGTSGRVAPGIALIVAAAFCGSVLVLIKPYYVVAYVAPAVYVAWCRRSFWSLFAPENCIIAVVGAVYVGLVFWLAPEFIRVVIPQVVDTYVKTGDPAWVALHWGPVIFLIVVLTWLIARHERMTPLCAVAILASVAAVAPLIYQGKGWPYHAFPAVSLGFAAVLCRIAAAPGWRRNLETLGRLCLCAIVVVSAWMPFLVTQKPDKSFVAAVRAASMPGSTLGVIGSDLSAAHPLTRMLGARFLSKNNSDWFGALALDLSRQAAQKGNAADADRYKKLSDAYLDEKYAEFASNNYDLIVVEDDQPPWTDTIFSQPRFAALMAAYRPVAKDERLTVFAHAAASQASDAKNAP